MAILCCASVCGADPSPKVSGIDITVVGRSSQAPLPGAEVSLRLGHDSEPATQDRTDAAGQCRLGWPVGQHRAVRVLVAKPGWAPLEMSWPNTDSELAPPARFTFLLVPSRMVGGTVRDETGRPVSGAHVRLNFPQRLTGPRVPVDAFPIVTDGRGRWQTDIVPADAGYIRVTVSHPDYVAASGPGGSEPPPESLHHRTAVFTLRRVLMIEGRVLDPAGHPVAGAEVVRGQQWGILGPRDADITRTDAAGKFHFAGASAGKVMLAAQAAGFGPALEVVAVKAGAAPVTLGLQPPAILRGRVSDPDGHPLADVLVRANGWRGYRYPGWETRTGPDGSFVFRTMPSDEVEFDFEKAGYMTVLFHRLRPGPEEQQVRLTPTLRVHGTVVDAARGEPIARFTITPGSARQESTSGGKLEDHGAFWSRRPPKTFSQGTYDLTLTEPVVQGGARVPDFVLRVDAEGYDPAVSRYLKPDEGEAEIDFRLERGKGLRGRIESPDGQPDASARVFAWNGFDQPLVRNGQLLSPGNATELTVNAHGVFTMPKPLEPTRLLVLADAGYAELNEARLATNPAIRLQRWATVEGTLKLNGRPEANGRVALWFRPRWEASARGLREVLGPLRDYQTRTDGEGHFQFRRVPPGEIGLMRVLDLDWPMGVSMAADEVWGGCLLAAIRVAPGQTARVTIGGEGQTVTGRAVLPPGIRGLIAWNRGYSRVVPVLPKIPLPAGLDSTQLQAWLEHWLWSGAGRPYRCWLGGTPQVLPDGQMMARVSGWPIKLEPDGQFRIDDLPAGQYRLGLMAVEAPSDRPAASPMSFAPDKALATLQHPFSVPKKPTGTSATALDLGALLLRPAPTAPAGLPVRLLARRAADLVGRSSVGAGSRDGGAAVKVPAPSARRPVTATVALDPPRFRPGGTTTVLVKVRLAPGHHINQLGASGAAATATRITLELPHGLEPAGLWQAPKAMPLSDGSQVYYGGAVFRRRLRVATDSVAGPLTVRCRFHYQVCNDLGCWPPVTIALAAEGRVVSSP